MDINKSLQNQSQTIEFGDDTGSAEAAQKPGDLSREWAETAWQQV
jgi:hypothetical protein